MTKQEGLSVEVQPFAFEPVPDGERGGGGSMYGRFPLTENIMTDIYD